MWRNFRPTTVSRNLYDTVFSSEIAAITDHTYQHVHVFGKRVSTISPRSHHHILVEHTVTSRNVRHGIDSRPPHLSDKKRTHVFQGLENNGHGVCGGLSSTICPFSIRQPFEAAMTPLTAITSSDSKNGMIQREIASLERMQSTSVLMKYG